MVRDHRLHIANIVDGFLAAHEPQGSGKDQNADRDNGGITLNHMKPIMMTAIINAIQDLVWL